MLAETPVRILGIKRIDQQRVVWPRRFRRRAIVKKRRLAHRAWRMRGPIEKRVQEIERDVRRVSRQSLTANCFLPAGHVLEARDLTCKRPGTGLSPARLGMVVGRSLARAVDANMPLVDEDLA